MLYLQTIIFGIIQGITEFVPVSSSGHLVILHEFLGSGQVNELAFDVALHIGTLVALIIYFYKDLSKYFKAFFRSFKKFEVSKNTDQRLGWLIALSIIPAGFVGYFFEVIIDQVLRDLTVVVGMLIIGALLFFAVEKWGRQLRSEESLRWKGVLFIACAQVLALIPGTSRSGITMTAGMALQMTRKAAARFSFLMSVPIIFLAGIKKSIDVYQAGVGTEDILVYSIGIIIAALFGYLSIKYMLLFLEKYSLKWFAWYRLILALILIVYML